MSELPTTEGDRHQARRLAGGWLSTADAAVQLGGCSVAHVRRLIGGGHLKAFDAATPGARRPDWRLRQEWIDDYREQRMSAAKGAAA